MSSTASLALIGLVVVAGSFLLAAAGWLIWRIEQQGEESASLLTGMAHELHGLLRLLNLNAELMTEQAQGQRDERRQGAEAAFTRQQLTQIVAAVEPLLQAIAPAATTPADSPADDFGAELRRVLSLKGRLEGELETLREQHNLQVKSLAEQRRDHQTALAALSNSSALRDVNEQLIGELRDARQRNQELAAGLEPVMTELKILREQMNVLTGMPSLEGSNLDQALTEAAERAADVFQERIEKLEGDLRQAGEEAMRVKDELSRTLREKSFIEDRFLDLAEAEAAEAA